MSVALATTAPAELDRMKTLVGVWRPADKPGSALRIRFSTTAGGATLLEEWLRAGQPHSLTVYHANGARLLLTHYCPQGNQPRLTSTPAGAATIRFTFADAADLDPGESHLRELTFDLSNADRIKRTEVYRQNGKDDVSELILVRDR